MNIFIDESGSFVSAPSVGSFNSIAAYMSPESDRRTLREILSSVKLAAGFPTNAEVKLADLSEAQYFRFLNEVSRLHGALYSVATDAGLNQLPEVKKHQVIQAEKIALRTPMMHFQAGRDHLHELSVQVAALAPQLYVQLQCQMSLIEAVIRHGLLYFVQRYPRALGRFRWRIDQKNVSRTEYETAFVAILPAYLQSISLQKPMPILTGADYSAFSRFDYSAESRPTYSRDIYGLEINEEQLQTDIGKLIREDLKFVDSEEVLGVQIADLLASGLRRCLRREFSDNASAAALLGKLMVQNYKGHPPIRLLGFSGQDEAIDDSAAELVTIMGEHSRRMLVR